MFTAVKFIDFPELDELRTTVFERYGTSLDKYVDKELAECLKLDKKLDLLQDIAVEPTEKEELRSKIIELNSMFVKTDSELDYLSTLDFRENLYIGCNVSTDAVQRYKDSHDEEVNNRIAEKVVLRCNVPN
ncbi:hypothetical protein C2S52_016187 [Perilla frutescens var. hirtella]|nr:hypothetical protein C2S52_016187 [Perilla frutescens var. hirtella]KAH6815068.1 hypothetical protein C2S51_019888 [Perilla frutescens var. frutescens]